MFEKLGRAFLEGLVNGPHNTGGIKKTSALKSTPKSCSLTHLAVVRKSKYVSQASKS